MIISAEIMKKPHKIEIDQAQADQLIVRMETDALTDFDKSIIKHVMYCYFWMQEALQESKISLKRILGMFGLKKTESSKNLEEKLNHTPENETVEDIMALLSVDDSDTKEGTKDEPKENHLTQDETPIENTTESDNTSSDKQKNQPEIDAPSNQNDVKKKAAVDYQTPLIQAQ